MPVRGTQSFLNIVGECWRRPSLLALEVLWRWAFGIPLLVVLGWEGSRIYSAAAHQLAATGVTGASLAYPMQAAVALSNVYAILAPSILQLLEWLIPVAVVAWAVASGIGRSVVLRRYDRSLPRRWGTLIALQLLRVIVYGGSVVLWFVSLQWASRVTLWNGSENIVGYLALVICFSLGIFTVWALVSWVSLIAPVLALVERRGVASSLVRSFRLGPLTGKLIEINLTMGVIKLALMVLAMVWSAIPLPFETVVQGNSLYAWWAVGTIVYFVVSDFFQVARLAAFIELWRTFQPVVPAPDQQFAASK
ncbi:MAG: hypothetical protein WAM66_10415 [Acidobacteriaceae bacterium]